MSHYGNTHSFSCFLLFPLSSFTGVALAFALAFFAKGFSSSSLSLGSFLIAFFTRARLTGACFFAKGCSSSEFSLSLFTFFAGALLAVFARGFSSSELSSDNSRLGLSGFLV